MAKTIIFEDNFDTITFENESKTITLKDNFDTIIFDVLQEIAGIFDSTFDSTFE